MPSTKKTCISRIVKLNGFDNVLLGRDLGNALKEGVVYGITNLAGVIFLTELGEHAQGRPNGEDRTISQIAVGGEYCLTKEEYAEQLKREEE